MAELAVMAATGLGASASTAATIGTVVSVGLTAASAFGSLSAGNQQSANLELQARQADLNARTEKLEGRRAALQIQEQLDRDLASQNALFAARGILEGEGTAAAAKDEATRQATKDIDLARFNSDINAGNAQTRAGIARADAKAAKQQGIFNALDTVSGLKFPSTPGGGGSKVPIPKRKPSLVG